MCLGLFCYESSMTLGVWSSDGRDYYEVRAVNHDTDEDYLLNGFNLTCAEVYIRRKLLRQYRTNELVRRRMNFSSDAMADFEGLLEVNRKICKQQMAEKASSTLPTNCAVLP